MPRWTKEQERILRESIHLGAEVCASQLFKLTGTLRSKEAIERHARRIGLSTTRYHVCPSCGKKVSKLNVQSRRCLECSKSELVANARSERNRLWTELHNAKSEESVKELDREYARLRKQNERLRKSLAELQS